MGRKILEKKSGHRTKSEPSERIIRGKYYRSFDTLKGLAVFMVCICGHYWQFSPGKYWTSGDKTGVAITNWFIHTGFRTYPVMELLLMISGFQMFAAYQKIADGNEPFGSYILKKVQRIFPMTVLGTLLMVIGLPVYKALTGQVWYSMELKPLYVLENLFNVQAWINTTHTLNGPLWYISVYFFCLLLFYLLAWLGSRIPLWKKYNFGAILMALPFAFGIIIYGKNYHYFLVNNDMARGYFAFFAGVLLAALCNILNGIRGEKKVWVIDHICMLMIFAWVYLRINYYDTVIKASLFRQAWIGMLLLFAPLLVILSQDVILDRIVGNPVLALLGKASFAMYVMNFPFYIWSAIIENKFGITTDYKSYKTFWYTALIQVALAIIFYICYEKPMARIGKKKNN